MAISRVEPITQTEGRFLDTLAAEQGREPTSVTISVFGQPLETTREQVDAFLNAGAVRVAVWPSHGETEQAMGEQ